MDCVKELNGADEVQENCGMFDVKTKAYLSEHDYVEKPIYTFKEGRWFVNWMDNMTWLIEWNKNPQAKL
jgi:hypothetical protein